MNAAANFCSPINKFDIILIYLCIGGRGGGGICSPYQREREREGGREGGREGDGE